jgi:hypothetical protein
MGWIAATKAVVGWGAAGLFAILLYKIIFPSKPKGGRPAPYACCTRSVVGRAEAILSQSVPLPCPHVPLCTLAH